MAQIDFSETLIHCSSLYKLMTQPATKAARDAGELSETAKTHLLEVYVKERYKRIKDIYAIAMEKGTTVEEDSITLLSRYDGVMYRKNTQTFSNEYIIGTPDIIHVDPAIGDENPIKGIKDIKSKWDLFTHTETLTDDMEKAYYWQLNGYMYLTDKDPVPASYGEIANCLIDTPDYLIEAKIRKEMYELPDSMLEFVKETMYRELRFSDVEMNRRVIKKVVYRSQVDINRIPDAVKSAREYLALIDSLYSKNGVINKLP